MTFKNVLFLAHDGVRVYHVHKTGRREPLTYWYTTSDHENGLFDVRRLPGWDAAADQAISALTDGIYAARLALARATILEAISGGLITSAGVQYAPARFPS